jgi:ABC-2 type transport system ATP-binding protein
MIRAQGLTKDYGRNRAVDDVSFDIEQGDIVGLLGPNGSGKTTIMRMLTGFFAPTNGTCEIAGVDVQLDPAGARRHIGYLPERVALYPDITVRRYLKFVAGIHDMRGGVSARVEEAMEECGLTQMAGRHIGKLSRGYRQRVGIAQALIHNPSVLILDEPTVGLDPRQIVEIRALIRRLAGRATVLLSTHILPEISLTCRRVLILDHGRLVAQDTSEGLARKTAGRGETKMRLSAPAGEARDALAAIDGVRDVRVEDEAPDGTVTISVISSGDDSPNPLLVAKAVERGWPVHEVAPKLVSLEDLFVEILEQAGGGER